MKYSLQFVFVVAAVITTQLCIAGNSNAAQIILPATADTTIYSNAVNNSGGGHSFGIAGQTNSGRSRNMLVRFDLSGVAPGSIINSARLDLNISQIGNAGGNFELFRINTNWGEGNQTGNEGSLASAGDATWNEAVFGSTSWSAPGGTFFAPLLDDVIITTVGASSFNSTANFTSAVQAMVDDPTQNFGFLISSPDILSAIRIGTREGGAAASLEVDFTAVPEPTSSAIFLLGLAGYGLRRSRN